MHVNGAAHRVRCSPSETLAEVLRRRLGLIGTKIACDRGECGACTVLVDGRAVLSCMTVVSTVAERRIETVEGLSGAGHPVAAPASDQLSPLQEAFLRRDAFQCGYCTPGFLMAAAGLLRAVPHPSRAEVVAALAGNICRCGAYGHIVDAILEAAGGGASGAGRAAGDGEGVEA
ncbi:MAG TPA: (2Fe-2S)-binding protein [Limnochordia bacterium]